MQTHSRIRYQALREELEVIASDELQGALSHWDSWSPAEGRQLSAYLRNELQPHGMLSVEKAREAGQALGLERRQAQQLITRL